MLESPLISVILPVFNGQQYLSIAIENILEQSFRDFELIIMNDGSTDDSNKIIQSFLKIDSRIIYIKNERNQGLPASLNRGIKSATGKYITWTSHDNLYAKDALNVMVNSIQENEADFVYADCEVIDEYNSKVGFLKSKPIEHLFFGNVVHACFLYKRAIHEQIGFYDEYLTLIEDYDFWLRCAQHFKMVNIDTVLYQYRFHEASLTHSIENNTGKKEVFEANKEKMFGKVLDVLNPEKRSIKKLLLSPSNTIYKSMKEGKIKILLADYRSLAIKFKSFNTKYSNRLFALNFFDIAVSNTEFHNLGLIKLLFTSSKLMFNLSVKQNLVLVKKAVVG